MNNCYDCPIHKFYAKTYDIHLDIKDCQIDCKAKRNLHKEYNNKEMLGNGKHPEYER